MNSYMMDAMTETGPVQLKTRYVGTYDEFLSLTADRKCSRCHRRADETGKTGDDGEPLCRHHAADLPNPFRHPSPRLGRNDACRCGSEKKFKKCCLRKKEDNGVSEADPGTA